MKYLNPRIVELASLWYARHDCRLYDKNFKESIIATASKLARDSCSTSIFLMYLFSGKYMNPEFSRDNPENTLDKSENEDFDNLLEDNLVFTLFFSHNNSTYSCTTCVVKENKIVVYFYNHITDSYQVISIRRLNTVNDVIFYLKNNNIVMHDHFYIESFISCINPIDLTTAIEDIVEFLNENGCTSVDLETEVNNMMEYYK